MKLNQTLMLTAMVAGSLWAGSSALQAQDTPTNNPPAMTPPPAHPANGMRPRASFDTIAKALELTDDQKTKVKPIMDDMRQQYMDLNGDTTLTMTEKREKMKDIRTATTAKLKDILTADQLAKWQKMGPGNRRPPMTPPPSADGATPPPAPPTPPPAATPDSVK